MMHMSDDEYLNIVQRRDPKYDGRFYFGVKTTRIYCRPVCPARPKPENIVIFKSAAQAENAGFRPCKRCCPDLSPGEKIADKKYRIISDALSLLDSGDVQTVVQLAAELNTSPRHLRRLFAEYLGASPMQVLTTKKLHFARALLSQSQASVTDIAFAAGFSSIRRFNEVFKQHYHVSPGVYRTRRSKFAPSQQSITFELPVRPPYDWHYVIAFLANHCIYGIESVRDNVYCRTIVDHDKSGKVEVSFLQETTKLRVLCVNLSLSMIKLVLPRIVQLFDGHHNPAYLPCCDDLRLCENAKGVRVIGAYNAYETAVSIIIGQLISVRQAGLKLRQLVEQYGEKLQCDDQEHPVYRFPEPRRLMQAPLEAIGMTRVKAHAIRELSKKIDSGDLTLHYMSNIEQTKLALLAIKGIGIWTAEVIAMRCLGDVDAFPENDLAVKRTLLDDTKKQRLWQGQRAYLCHIIWRNHTLSKNTS